MMNKTREELQREESAIMGKWFDEWHQKKVNGDNSYPDWSYEEEIAKLRSEWRQSLEPGDHVHICHYSDIDPGTVIKKTKSSIYVRTDKAHLDDKWKPEFIPGGFGAHCTNDGEQISHWVIEEDLDGSVEIFRWSKKYNRYRNRSGEFAEPGWLKYYDYNF